jgi:hypothetical protein
MVKAVVVRGSFWKKDSEGNNIEVRPGMGKDSEVEVTENQLNALAGVLVAADKAEAEIKMAASESMAGATSPAQAVAPPGPPKTSVAGAPAQSPAGAGARRVRGE